MNNRELEQPEFTTSIRGYDRLQVDEYIGRLRSVAAETGDRARTAEAELEFSRHATVGPRVAQIFDLAVEESKELRERVTTEAESIREQARGDAELEMTRADEYAAKVEDQTERERQDALAAIDAAEERARRNVEQLEQRKHALLADLRRLQEALAAAAGIASDEGAHDASVETTTEELRTLPAGSSDQRDVA